MKKTAAYLTFALALGSLIFSSMAQGLGTASVSINFSGTINARTSTSELNKVVIIYGTATLDATQIANVAKFDMLIVSIEMTQSTLASIKSLNPNIMILVYMDSVATTPDMPYWSTVNANEDWFVHDVNGNRVIDIIWGGWFLMNPASGWRQFYASYASNLLSTPLYDGIFADDVLNQIQYPIWAGVFADATTNAILTSSDFSSSFISNWHSDMLNFLQYVKDNIGSGKKLIINTDEYLTNTYLTLTDVDGKMCEGFASRNTEAGQIEYINSMIRDSATGKIFIASTYVPTPNSTPTAEYCYIATLLAINGDNCYFGYNAAYYYSYEGGVNHMPDFVINLGSPSGSYYQSQGVYMRNFAGGVVLCNPSNNSYDINLGKNYQLTNGTIVSRIVIGSWSGEILLSYA